MFSYIAYGLNIRSDDLPLPELVPGAEGASVVVRLGRTGHQPGDDGPVKCLEHTDKEIKLYWGKVGTAIIRNRSEIIVDPAPGVEEQVLRLFILGPILGVLLHQRGHLVLHASSVAINGEAVAFLGWKGWGKSTTAAALHTRGHTLISDDLLVVSPAGGGALVLPGFPQFKLWPDAAIALGDDLEMLPRLHPKFEKRARPAGQGFCPAALPLRAIYILAAGTTLEVEAVPSQSAFVELLHHSYAPRFLGNPGVNPTHFRQCVRLSGCVPFYRLKRPYCLSTLSEVARLVEEHCSGEAEQASIYLPHLSGRDLAEVNHAKEAR